ncbi:MAG: family 43 glycosylhydrolase [Bacteroidaceae bacterium]|nr:family 43 glycosylhydrolase [Bacteroidaceae bacterium]
MKRHHFPFWLLLLLVGTPVHAETVVFEKHFADSTLRIDYVFSGTNHTQHIAVDKLSKTAGWYGRRYRLDQLPLEGNGQLTVLDAASGDTLYRHSFSTLFQEWQETEEARHAEKAFENTYLIPLPKRPVDVICQLVDTHRSVCSTLKHRVNPSDILIRDRSEEAQTPWRYLRKGGDSRDCIDVAFVAEGYTEKEMPAFLAMCDSSISALEAHEPFRSMIRRFNFIAVMPPSRDSGVSIPHRGIWKQTALSSSFDTFYSNRYLTTLHIQRLYDVMTGIPFEHFIILANTSEYGGGGIYNSYNMASAGSPHSKLEVIVHEFGHSFAGLGDEYAYGDDPETHYPSDTEPWEPNLTTLHDFSSKWQDMLPPGTAIPTKPDGRELTTKVGVYEGAGYQAKGVFRPAQQCRMKVNEVQDFCPVCQRAIRRMIDFYTPATLLSGRWQPRYRENVPTDSIQLSDPCILADSATHTYYMTGTGGLLWTSKDLQTWDGPRNVIEIDTTSWMGAHPQIWAAELHQYKGKYYYFATFTNNAITIDNVRGHRIPRRACHVFVADKPDGPYRPMPTSAYLSPSKPTLDGTLWVDVDKHPYMVYCYEWLQAGYGTIEKIRLADDLSASVGSPQHLFSAADAPWSRGDDVPEEVAAPHRRPDGTVPNVVTDGPWLFRTQTGRLGMIWTSWIGTAYTMGVAYSQSGTLNGPWIHEPEPLTPPNYGHGMLFHDWKGRLLLSVHSHSVVNGRTIRRPHFFLMDDEGDKLITLANFVP